MVDKEETKQTTGQTVLVKKADGTTIRVPLENVMEGKTGVTSAKPKPPEPAQKTAPIAKPQATKKRRKIELKVSKKPAPPVKPSVLVLKKRFDEDEALDTRKEWKKEDTTSPLDQKLEEKKEEFPEFPALKDEASARIIEKLNFSIPEDLKGRLGSLIQSWIKEVRSSDQVLEYALKPAQKGGLGLTENQANKLIQVLKNSRGGKISKETSKKTIKESTPTLKDIRAKKEVQKIVQKPAQPQVRVNVPSGPVRTMQDMLPPTVQSKTVGPVEELGLLTLIDFRRLGKDIGEQVAIILDKFKRLKEESFVQYIKAKEAWFVSPLYKRYLEILKKALNQKQPLSTTASKDPQGMIMEEIKAMVEINKKLS